MTDYYIDLDNGSDDNTGTETTQSAAVNISAVTAADDQVTTATPHGLTTGDEVVIAGNTGSVPDINGANQAITVIDTTNFTIDGVDITTNGNADGTVQEENGPWLTINQFTNNVRSAGDTGIVRRGTTETASADVAFANSGQRYNPIILEADFDDAFGDEVDLSGTATATLTWGSKTITFSADVSGVLAANDWIYVDGEDNRVYAYEVASVSTVTVTLFLLYKGEEAGSGKTMHNMQAAPIWNDAVGSYVMALDSDSFWAIQGLSIKGTDFNGAMENDSSVGTVFRDCIFTGNGSADYGLNMQGGEIFVSKCRFFDYLYGIDFNYGKITVKNCLFDADNTGSSRGITPGGASDPAHLGFVEECEFKNHASGDIGGADVDGVFYLSLRNCIFSSATEIVDYIDSQVINDIGSEDHDNVVGVNKNFREFDTSEGTPALQSESTIVRGGGGDTSIEVTPSVSIGVSHFSRIKVFEYPIYASTDSKTYTVYFRTEATGDWTADPTNVQLWIELDAWYDASNKFRKITKSTGTCDFNGTTDWVTLTVTVAPAIAGVAYLRCYYAKSKEGGKSNIFFVDTKIAVT